MAKKPKTTGATLLTSPPADPIRKFVVYSVRKPDPNLAAVWVRAGYATTNPDGSVNVTLDVLPIDGKLHLRNPERS